LYLDRRLSAFSRADPDDFFHRRDEYLAVSDAARFGGCFDGLDDFCHQVVGRNDLELYLGQKVNDVFSPPIELGVALLSAETLYLGHGDALNADGIQSVLYLVELERLNDRFYFFHEIQPPVTFK